MPEKIPKFEIVIVFAAIVVAGGFFWASKNFESLSLQISEQQKNAEMLESVLLATNEKLESLSNAVALSDEERALQEEQTAALQEQLGELSGNVSQIVESSDVSAYIAEWSPFIYVLSCEFTLENGETDIDKGSATLERYNNSIRLITNKHVIGQDDARFEGCTLTKPDSEVEYRIDDSRFVKNEDVDYAYAFVQGPTSGVSSSRRCSIKPNIGDPVLILGYPGIGAKESITATEGIISGFDSDYYTTSAKIEKGNSGGAAIDMKRDCFIGLPTLVVAGRAESLARILPVLGL